MRVVENFLYGVKPFAQLPVGKVGVASFVFPMGGNSLLVDFVHALRPYLHLNPLAALTHKGDVQRLVSVGLRRAYPIAQPVGLWLVYMAQGYIYVEALVYFFFRLYRLEDYARGEYVVNFLECNMLVLHFPPNGIRRLNAGYYTVFEALLVEFTAYGFGKLIEKTVAFGLR